MSPAPCCPGTVQGRISGVAAGVGAGATTLTQRYTPFLIEQTLSPLIWPGERILITAATNDTVNTLNERIQKTRLNQLDISGTSVLIADGGERVRVRPDRHACNDRDLKPTVGSP
jgi:hypothetical protein